MEKENQILKDSVTELKKENTTLHDTIIEKEIQLQQCMNRASDMDFALQSDKKLLEAERVAFSKERENLLQQIQDLTSQINPSSKNVTYSEALSKDNWPSLPNSTESTEWQRVEQTSPRTNKTQATKPAPITVSNRFSSLVTEEVDVDNNSPKPTPSNNKEPASPRHSTKNTKSNGPHLVILGDSIGCRIDGKKLSRKCNVTNLCVGGRRIEQVCDDISENNLDTATSVIVHVGTNNLNRDSDNSLKTKYKKLCDTIKSNVPKDCEVALSSIVTRKDNLSNRVDAANTIISDFCELNKWTFIDNHKVEHLCRDNLHPNAKGMSYIARNYQDFLRCVHPTLFHYNHNARKDLNSVPNWVRYLAT